MKKGSKMEAVSAMIFLAVMAIVLVLWSYKIGGTEMVRQGGITSVKMLLGYLPLLLLIFIVCGFGIVLANAFKQELQTTLSGNAGIWWTAGAGVLFPSISGYPLANEMWKSGLNHGPLFVFFGVGALFNLMTIVFRAPMMGTAAIPCYLYVLFITLISVPILNKIGQHVPS